MGGWIAVSRKLLDPDHDLWEGESVPKWAAWIDLIGQAEWRTDADLDRGCFQFATEFLRRRWHWPTKRKVHVFLKGLGREDRIEKVSDGEAYHDPPVYRIVNYDQYQFEPDTPAERPTERPTERQEVGGSGIDDEERNDQRNDQRNDHLSFINKQQQGGLFSEETDDELGPSAIRSVWEHYVSRYAERYSPSRAERLKLDAGTRRSKIRARLNEGYEAGDLQRAIDGFWYDDWHANRKKDDLEYILRNQTKVESGLTKFDEHDGRRPTDDPHGYMRS